MAQQLQHHQPVHAPPQLDEQRERARGQRAVRDGRPQRLAALGQRDGGDLGGRPPVEQHVGERPGEPQRRLPLSDAGPGSKPGTGVP